MISIPASPLPELKALFKAFLLPENFVNLWSFDKNIFVYSRGMWALSSGIQALLMKRRKKDGIIWFPDYFCNEALMPVRKLPIVLNFYQICRNLEPNWDILEKKIKDSKPPDIFVLVHYFGFPNNLKKARDFCEKYQIELIEDAAHVLLPSCGIGEGKNPVVYSPRKVLPVPEGGILVVPDELLNYVKQPYNVFINNTVIVWFIKRFVQKIMIKLRIPWHTFWHSRDHRSFLSSPCLPLLNCSTITKRLLTGMPKDFKQILQKRRNNYNLLCEELVNKNIYPFFTSLPDHTCPYAFPVLVKKGRDLILEKLQRRGIPASSWPDLPPEVLKDKKMYKEAVWLQKHIILFPVHQSLSKRQMEYIIETYKEVVRGKE